MAEAVRVIGVGNPDRGDDGVGPLVASLVAKMGADAVISTADPSRLLDAWSGAARVVLVDAVVDGFPTGTVRRFDATHDAIPADGGAVSSHGMGVGAAIALGRSLGRLPDRLTLVGVSASDFERIGLSEPVQRAVAGAVDMVMEEVAHA